MILFLEYLHTLKGSVATGQTYINLIKKEFNIQNFEGMLNNIRTKFIEAMSYYAAWRDWNIDSTLYGRPITGAPPLQLSIEQLYDTSCDVMRQVIDRNLPKRNLQAAPELSLEEQVTFDKLKKILETATSNTDYSSTVPAEIAAAQPIRGCTDPNALNYNASAEVDDGTCIYQVESDGTTNEDWLQPTDPVRIKGCMDVNALNYDPMATFTCPDCCKYKVAEPETITATYYSWCQPGTIQWTNRNGALITNTVSFNQSITIRYLASTTPWFSCQFELYPKKVVVEIIKCDDISALNYGEVGECIYTPYPEPIEDETIVVYNDEIYTRSSDPSTSTTSTNTRIVISGENVGIPVPRDQYK
jgi:hypothetical protein